MIVPGVALADVSFTYPQLAGCETKMLSIQVAGSRMRIDSPMQGHKFSMLFDGLEDMVTSLDHQNHSFYQIEVDEDALDYNADVMSSTGTYIGNQMNTMQAQMKQQCAQMEKQGFSCANMPDMASMMQSVQAMSAQQMPVIEVKQSDKNQTVAGMACKTYDRFQNGIKTSEECYVEPKDILMLEKDKKYLLRNLKVLYRHAKTMTGLTDKLMPATNTAASVSDPADKDFLVSQVCFAPSGNEVGRIEVQIGNTPIDESSFEIPPGYQAMKLMGD
ncbi:MAG: hypothetical protein ACREO2_08180 [Arenimonas sp.]